MITNKIALVTLALLLATSICMAIPGNAHAGKVTLPKEILGMWCYYSANENGDVSYLRNDASAPEPGTPCKSGGNAEWIAIDTDGSYHGQEDGCRAVRVTVIDRGHVIKGTPGANAVYGVVSRCEGEGMPTWTERARIEIERWGSALTMRTKRIK
jgi:hypothetical protein